MPKISFIAECGNPGADNTAIDLAGLGLPGRPLVLTANFDAKQAVASCVVSKVPEGLLVEADVPEAYMPFYPAIGFSVLKSEANEHGGQTITAAKLLAVSLSSTPNSDATIRSLSEQQIRDTPKLLDLLKDA